MKQKLGINRLTNMNFRDRVEGWVGDYIKDKEEANDLTNIIVHYAKKEFKFRLRIGLFAGFVSFYIILKWLS